MSCLQTEEQTTKMTEKLKTEHFVYLNGKLKTIVMGENWFYEYSLYINLQHVKWQGNLFLSKIILQNVTDEPLPVNIFVKNILNDSSEKYIFASPKRNVLLLMNEDGLYVTSGLIRKNYMDQYGVLHRGEYLKKIKRGRIPFNPIGSGNVVGVFSLKEELKPYEEVVAYTWILGSSQISAENLFSLDEHLKSRLAFS